MKADMAVRSIISSHSSLADRRDPRMSWSVIGSTEVLLEMFSFLADTVDILQALLG
jgi:hypothetical protein